MEPVTTKSSSSSSKKSKYTGTNLNAEFKAPARPAPRLASKGSTKLEVLDVRAHSVSTLKKAAKPLAVPKPLNTPSQAHAHNGQDPTIDIIAKAGGTGWGADVDNANREAAAQAAAESELAAVAAANAAAAHAAAGGGPGPWAAPSGAPQPERPRRGLSDFNPFDRTANRARQPSVVSARPRALRCIAWRSISSHYYCAGA
jgi:hypothetical protein